MSLSCKQSNQFVWVCLLLAQLPTRAVSAGLLLRGNLADSCQHMLIIIMLGKMLIKLGQVS